MVAPPTLLQWIARRQGHPVDPDGLYGPQCMDLVNDYLETVLRHPAVGGNAVDTAGALWPGFRWISNKPTNVPSYGDVVTWVPGGAAWDISQYGHIAVVVAADVRLLLTFDQNWPEGSAPHFVIHDYHGCAGWHTKLSQ